MLDLINNRRNETRRPLESVVEEDVEEIFIEEEKNVNPNVGFKQACF